VRKQTFSRIKKTIGILLAVLLIVPFTVALASSSSWGHNREGCNDGYWGDYWYPGHVHSYHDGHFERMYGSPMFDHAGHWSGLPGYPKDLFVTHYPGDEDGYGNFWHHLEYEGYA
jgi:hypothetical protein